MERVASFCLHWADEIFTKLGEDSVWQLCAHRDFVRQINAMYSHPRCASWTIRKKVGAS